MSLPLADQIRRTDQARARLDDILNIDAIVDVDSLSLTAREEIEEARDCLLCAVHFYTGIGSRDMDPKLHELKRIADSLEAMAGRAPA